MNHTCEIHGCWFSFFYHLLLQRSVLDRNHESVRENYCFFPPLMNKQNRNQLQLEGSEKPSQKMVRVNRAEGQKKHGGPCLNRAAMWPGFICPGNTGLSRLGVNRVSHRGGSRSSPCSEPILHIDTGITGIIHKNRLRDDQWSVFYGSQAFLEKWNWQKMLER